MHLLGIHRKPSDTRGRYSRVEAWWKEVWEGKGCDWGGGGGFTAKVVGQEVRDKGITATLSA
jgi:hypothetical protein